MLDFALAVTVVISISEIAKRNGMATKFLPILNIGLGLIAAIGFMGVDLQEAIIQGILVGLSASGIYDNGEALGRVIKGGK